MSQATKAELWKQLKEAGVEFPLHYREYNTEQLQAAVDKLRGETIPVEPVKPNPAALAAAYEGLEVEEEPKSHVPVTSKKDEHAGLRLNTKSDDEPIRVDPETGFLWYQDEVRKAAYPKPRGRRVLKYTDTGVKRVTMREDDTFTESFEMPGDGNRIAEARITLPSYQVGVYRNPKLPFRIHTYDSREGYDLFEVEAYYGGPERVPAGVKRIYVSNVLCYDIRSVNQAIEAEYRERVLGVTN